MVTLTADFVCSIDRYYSRASGNGRFHEAARKLTNSIQQDDSQMAKTDPDQDAFSITKDSTLVEAFAHFMKWFKRDFAPKTCETYQTWFAIFLKFLENEKQIAAPTVRDFRAPLLEQYLDYNRDRAPLRRSICHVNREIPATINNNTVRAAFYVLTAFAKWLVKKGVLAKSPMTSIDLPKKDYSYKGKRPVASMADARRLVEEIQRDPSLKHRVLYTAIFLLLANSLARVAEVTDALLCDLDMENKTLWSDAKGRRLKAKVNYIFDSDAAQAIRDWLAIRPDNKHGLIFCHGEERCIAPEHIRNTIRQYAKKAGIKMRTV